MAGAPSFRTRRRRVRNLLLTLVFLFLASPAFAQVPSGSSVDSIGAKVREEARRKLLEKKEEKKPVIEAERPTQEKKEEVKFLVRKIILSGNEVIPEETLRPILSRYEGREITFSEVDALTLRLEDEFRREGYFAVVYAPPQRIENQELTLQVVISRMGDLHLEGARYFQDRRTRSYWPIRKGERLRYDRIRQGVNAMNENPDRLVKAVMRPGEESGTSDIFLKVQDRFPLHVGASYDNHGTKLLGKERPSFWIRDNNFVGMDDILLAGALFGSNYGGGYIQYLFPITTWGTRLAYGFTYFQTSPKKEFEELGENGISQVHNVTLYQKIHHSDTFSVDAHFGFDYKDNTTKLLSEPFNRNRLRVLSAGAEFESQDETGSWFHTQDFFYGLPKYGEVDSTLTSRGAGSNFFKYILSVGRHQNLFWGTRASVNLQAQLSPDKLTTDEELFLGGATSVRGYPESDFGADQAVILNIEYWLPFYLAPKDWKLPGQKQPLKEQLNFLVFYDEAHGRLRSPSDFEKKSHNMNSIGAGFDFQMQPRWSARLECGYAMGDQPITEGGRWQVHYSFRTEF